MSTKQLNFKSLPVIAAADGATSPALTASDKGALAFSTTISKALMWDGAKWTSAGLKGDTGATGAVSAADQTKLNGIQAGATANATDAQLRDRSTHTGAQAIATVTGLQSMLDGKSSTTHTHANASTTVAGFMSDADKTKIDGISAGANAYVHPANHPASVITQDASNRFVSDAEKTAWNAKQAALGFTPVQQGGGANQGANKIYLGWGTDSKLKLQVDATDFGSTWPVNISLNAATATALSVGADRTKLDGIAASANNYAHPATHPASVIAQDASNRFVTDAEKTGWDAKQPAGTYATGTGTASGTNTGDQTTITGNAGSATTLSTGADRTKLDGIAAGATAYAHPATHPASVITQDASNRFVTDTEKAAWNEAGNKVKIHATTKSVAIGTFSGGQGGTNNVAIGLQSMQVSTTGGYNSCIGHNSLQANQDGAYNTAIGAGSIQNNTTGTNNSALGYFASNSNTTGGYNVAIGPNALRTNKTGNSNVAIGSMALSVAIGEGRNTAIGSNALQDLTTGVANICIGTRGSTPTSTPVFNVVAQNDHVVMGSSTVTNAYIKVAWTVVSDARDKTNFKAIPHGLDFVKQLKPTAYQFRTDRGSEKTNGGVRYGFKAQDIAAIEPEAVIVDITNPEKLYYNESNLIPILVKAIQELSAEVERLKNANSNT